MTMHWDNFPDGGQVSIRIERDGPSYRVGYWNSGMSVEGWIDPASGWIDEYTPYTADNPAEAYEMACELERIVRSVTGDFMAIEEVA